MIPSCFSDYLFEKQRDFLLFTFQLLFVNRRDRATASISDFQDRCEKRGNFSLLTGIYWEERGSGTTGCLRKSPYPLCGQARFFARLNSPCRTSRRIL